VYLASAGFCWLLTAVAARVAERIGWRPVAAAALVLLAAYSARAVIRNREWRHEIAFYLPELKRCGDSPPLPPSIIHAFLRSGQLQPALQYAREWVSRAPDEARAHNSLGMVYATLGQRELALAAYERAAEVARRKGQTAFAARALNNVAVASSSREQVP